MKIVSYLIIFIYFIGTSTNTGLTGYTFGIPFVFLCLYFSFTSFDNGRKNEGFFSLFLIVLFIFLINVDKNNSRIFYQSIGYKFEVQHDRYVTNFCGFPQYVSFFERNTDEITQYERIDYCPRGDIGKDKQKFLLKKGDIIEIISRAERKYKSYYSSGMPRVKILTNPSFEEGFLERANQMTLSSSGYKDIDENSIYMSLNHSDNICEKEFGKHYGSDCIKKVFKRVEGDRLLVNEALGYFSSDVFINPLSVILFIVLSKLSYSLNFRVSSRKD